MVVLVVAVVTGLLVSRLHGWTTIDGTPTRSTQLNAMRAEPTPARQLVVAPEQDIRTQKRIGVITWNSVGSNEVRVDLTAWLQLDVVARQGFVLGLSQHFKAKGSMPASR